MWKKLGFAGSKLFTRNLSYFAQQKANRDLYNVLGVTKTANQSDIKKAYYKLAQKYHPDRNKQANAQQKFAQINNAYQTLSDQSKRKIYDQTGSADGNPFTNQGGFNGNPNPNPGSYSYSYSGPQGQAGGQGFDPNMFSQFKNNFSGFGGTSGQKVGGMGGFQDLFGDIFGRNSQQGGMGYDSNLMLAMQIPFHQAVNGVTKNIEFNKEGVCVTCKGSRSKPGTTPINCNSCNGTGFKSVKQGMMVMQTVCQDCGGQGKKIKQYCSSCKGSGSQQTKAYQTITIPRGIQNNTNLRIKGKGNNGGDLFIKISVRPHPKFRREGINVHSQIQVPVVDLILGATKPIQTIYGRKANLVIPAGTPAGKKLKIASQGFYQPNSQVKGDHYVQIKPKIPTKLSPTEKMMYQQIRSISKDY